MKTTINQHVWAGKWKQLKGKVLQWWGQLTRNRWNQMRGRLQEFAGMLQERYGIFKQWVDNKISKPRKHIQIKLR